LLAPGAIATAWEKLKAQCRADEQQLTTLLELHPANWRELPWELLFCPNPSVFAFHDQWHAIGHRWPRGKASAFRSYWPLRMLVIVGGAPEEGTKLEEEVLAIRRAICKFSLRIDLKVLRPPFLKQFVQDETTRFRPHILHFIGHGTS